MNTESIKQEIDFFELYKILIKKKYFIAIITTLFAAVSILYSLSLTNYYQSSAVIKVANSDNPSSISSAISQYSGLASMAGISVPSSGADSKADIVIATIKSRDFFKHLLSFENMLQEILAADGFIPKTGKTIYDPKLFDEKNNKWIRPPDDFKSTKPSYLEAHKEYIDNILSISQDKKSGFIYISAEHPSPIFANKLLTIIIYEINKTMRTKELTNSDAAINYLTSLSSSTTISDIKQSINQILENQIQTKMLATVNEDYIISIVDSPFVPEKKSKPSRSSIVIFGTLMGFIISILIALVNNANIYSRIR